MVRSLHSIRAAVGAPHTAVVAGAENMDFFEACDGIFLNYHWRSSQLYTSARAAGKRSHDVYAGVDVFGRGTYGGGGMDTAKAVREARAVEISSAIFAPGK